LVRSDQGIEIILASDADKVEERIAPGMGAALTYR